AFCCRGVPRPDASRSSVAGGRMECQTGCDARRRPHEAGESTWDALEEVSVLTTAEGPFAEDVFFVLAGGGGSGCVVPQGAPESGELLERLQRLPGFDNEAFIRAMSSAEDARFLCWRRVVEGDGEAGGP